jgi:hypothetical protein
MRTVADMIKALEGLPPMAPVQVGLVGPDGGRVVREIDAIEAQEGGIVLVVGPHAQRGVRGACGVRGRGGADRGGGRRAAAARSPRWAGGRGGGACAPDDWGRRADRA